MTSRERLTTTLAGKIPDHVPVSPDTSNMIPARLTGKPFWDIYLYQNPPQWKAYIDCVKYFGFDSLMDGYASIRFEELGEIDHEWTEAIIAENESQIITRLYKKALSVTQWHDYVTVYYRDNPPTWLTPDKIGLSQEPSSFKPITGRLEWPEGEALLRLVKQEMGEHGLVGVQCGTSNLVGYDAGVFEYYDNPDVFYDMRDKLLISCEARFNKLMSLDVKPDFIATGASGSLVFQTPMMFRELSLPIVKKMAELCKEAGIPSHVHSCGPQAGLVKILAEETDLTVIDPLELPPHGDCNLRELKALYGSKIVLKGNLHTIGIMLRGTPQTVIDACKKAIDDGADGGGFILSTGDQCGRDTPDENLFAMIETAKTYGRY